MVTHSPSIFRISEISPLSLGKREKISVFHFFCWEMTNWEWTFRIAHVQETTALMRDE